MINMMTGNDQQDPNLQWNWSYVTTSQVFRLYIQLDWITVNTNSKTNPPDLNSGEHQ